MKVREQSEDAEKLIGLRVAIEAGLTSGIAKPGVFDRVRRKYDLPERKPDFAIRRSRFPSSPH